MSFTFVADCAFVLDENSKQKKTIINSNFLRKRGVFFDFIIGFG